MATRNDSVNARHLAQLAREMFVVFDTAEHHLTCAGENLSLADIHQDLALASICRGKVIADELRDQFKEASK